MRCMPQRVLASSTYLDRVGVRVRVRVRAGVRVGVRVGVGFRR